ncbi:MULTISPECIES: helicase-related protein [Agrobacterium]|uniref:helicase-related protein n=1 Tax=Agrobacterium tumefaciens TaxID=358 RepID=UPI001F1BB2CD
MKGVGRQGGDYKQSALQAAVDKMDVTRSAVDEIVAKGADRKSWLCFCSGVEHAEHVRDEIRSRGISCETISGETPKDERRRIIEDFKSYKIRALTNNSVLTTGFNHKGVDLIAALRPTLSVSLYVQMMGRGTRVMYVSAVVAGSPENRKQHELDAAASVTFNLGVGAMNWTWAEYWRKGQIKKAAAHLASNYNTAKGKKLPGLVRRRKEEALLFEKGIYTGVGVTKEVTAEPPVLPDPVVKEAQELLTTAGLNPGAIDGWMGEKTKAAVIAYQKAHPHLIADGIIGPATIAQLRRDACAAKDVVTKGASSAAGSGLLAFTAGLPWGWIAAGVLVAVVGYVAYRNRDVITRRWNSWRGKEVVV